MRADFFHLQLSPLQRAARHLLAFVLCAVATPLAWAQSEPSTTPSTLVPYTTCAYSDELMVASVDRMKRLPMMRSVDSASGSKAVLLADAYRVMLAYPNTHYFANLKVEQFVSERYAGDKESVVQQLKDIAGADGTKFEQATTNGIAVYSLNKPGIEAGGGVISVYTLFDDTKKVVATAYILNADPQHRAFDSTAQYLILRDKFVNALVACMAKNRE